MTTLLFHRMLESWKEGIAFSWHMHLAAMHMHARMYILGWSVQLPVGMQGFT